MTAQAIILAAGSGSRLRPYTNGCPKGMVSLAGTSLLERQIDVLRSAGIEEITLVGGYNAWMLDRFNCPIILNSDYQSTNMVTSLHKAKALFDGSREIVICYSDIIYEPCVLDALLSEAADVTVVADKGWQQLWKARMEDPMLDAESFRLNQDGSIAELGRTAHDISQVQGQYIGLISVARTVQHRFFDLYESLDPAGTYEGQPLPKLYLTGYLQLLIDAGWQVSPAWIQNRWLEIDTVEDLRIYHRMVIEDRLHTLIDLRQAGGAIRPMSDIFPGMEDFITKRLRKCNDKESAVEQILSVADFTSDLFKTVVPDATQLATLDRISRKIEISNRLYEFYTLPDFVAKEPTEFAQPATIEALLAILLAHFAWFGDLRHLNTVVKALNGPLCEIHGMQVDPALLTWCETALQSIDVS